jgi:predicted nucleic acid-binding Zn ribbon protein
VSAIGQLVGERLSGLQIEAKIREHTAPLVWAEVVGPQVAAATEVLGVENGVLRVSTKSAVWSNELTFYKADILRRLNARIGGGAAAREPAIKEILFQNRGLRKKRASADPPPLAPTPEELDDVELSAAEIRTIEAGVAGVSDEGLRARLRRVRLADARLRTWRLDNGWFPCPRCGDLTPPPAAATYLPSPGGDDGGGADPGGPPAAADLVCARCRLAHPVSGIRR